MAQQNSVNNVDYYQTFAQHDKNQITHPAHTATHKQDYGYNFAQGDGETGAADCGEEVSAKNLKVNMENFSRTLDKKYYTNAVTIASKLGTKVPMVTTWELMDKSFSFPRVRQFDLVRQEMSNIEMF